MCKKKCQKEDKVGIAFWQLQGFWLSINWKQEKLVFFLTFDELLNLIGRHPADPVSDWVSQVKMVPCVNVMGASKNKKITHTF